MFNGDGRAILQEDLPLDSLPGWVKVVGPIEHELASSIHGALKRFLEQSGVEVFDEGIAD